MEAVLRGRSERMRIPLRQCPVQRRTERPFVEPLVHCPTQIAEMAASTVWGPAHAWQVTDEGVAEEHETAEGTREGPTVSLARAVTTHVGGVENVPGANVST